MRCGDVDATDMRKASWFRCSRMARCLRNACRASMFCTCGCVRHTLMDWQSMLRSMSGRSSATSACIENKGIGRLSISLLSWSAQSLISPRRAAAESARGGRPVGALQVRQRATRLKCHRPLPSKWRRLSAVCVASEMSDGSCSQYSAKPCMSTSLCATACCCWMYLPHAHHRQAHCSSVSHVGCHSSLVVIMVKCSNTNPNANGLAPDVASSTRKCTLWMRSCTFSSITSTSDRD